MTDLDRFFARVEQTDGCWHWQGGKSKRGYGRFRCQDRTVSPHRFIYEQMVGPIPEGWTIDHLCANTACVNPAHLEATTYRVNILRGNNPAARNARKTHCVHGHSLTGKNLRVTPKGHRVCRTCQRAWDRQKYRKDLEAALGLGHDP